MKKILFGLLSILSSTFIWSQGYDKAQEYTPNTPIASEIMRHGLVPLNQYTGIPNIEVPIHSLDFDGRSLPIKLNYHAGGIRVNQEATWVGLGWSLSNQFVISRKINQRSDIGNDKNSNAYNGYCYENEIPENITEEQVESLTDFVTDTQPDIFTATLMGETVKFQLLKQDSSGVINALVLNESKADVSFDKGNRNFLIKDDQGFQYHFTKKEYSSTIHDSGQHVNDYFSMEEYSRYSNSRDKFILTSWFVSSIISPNGHELKFTYYGDETLSDSDSSNDIFYLSLSPTQVHENRTLITCNGTTGSSTTTSLFPEYTYSRSIHENKYLKEIVNGNTGERIVFKVSDRQDIAGYDPLKHSSSLGLIYGSTNSHNYRSPRRLESIEFYSAAGKVFKKAKLTQTYFNSHKTSDEYPDNHLRLKLDRISVDNQAYVFQYESPNSLPSKTTTAIDFWGFYNGNETEDPNQKIFRYPSQLLSSDYLYGLCNTSNVFPSSYWQPGGNLGSNFEYGRVGTLNKIIYPTGGSTNFLYESNTVKISDNSSSISIDAQTVMNLEQNINDLDNNPIASTSNSNTKTYKVGGLRVKSIENRDKNNELKLKKSYRYHGFGNSSIPMSSGKLMTGLVYFYPTESFDSNGNNLSTSLVVSNSNMTYGNNSAMGNHVGYSFVEETTIDANDVAKNNGKVITEFINEPNQQLNSTYGGSLAFDAPPDIYEEGNGKIKTQEFYDNVFNSTPKRVVVNVYDQFYIDGTNGLKIYYSDQTAYLLGSIGGSGIPLQYNTPYDRFPYRTKRSYWVLDNSTTTDYLENGTSLETRTFNLYNAKPQLTSTTTTNSKGDEIRSEYYYPYDTYLGVGSRFGMADLVTDNRIATPVYTRNYYDGNLLSHELTSFEYKNGILQPSLIGFQKNDAPLDQIENRIEFDQYDEIGNPIKFRKDNGPWTHMIWGYEGKYPIAQITNVSETAASIESIVDYAVINDTKSSKAAIKAEIDKIRNHSDYAQSQIVSYLFDPSIGVVETTDQRNYSTTYAYDDRERLKQVRDENDFLYEDYEYNQTYETTDCLENCDGEVTLSTSNYSLIRNQNFTIGYSISGAFTVSRWEIMYGDGNIQFGNGSPSNFTYSYANDEVYGLKPIRIYLYDANGNQISGNINVRLSASN
ncbi:hypothetical protein M3P19_15565 [Muricauda sp. 2012CJ35-5]|uniref:YD repeat-containing protein n=1 Tax=Flagellimonas spongiicola TaxID=2942208 RepID=A0ABT0PVL0_9FLAO|nr:hypothetical protein [Allomuricauda spongiicola]MCL6275432.1 hypothetical protein [Allomuricauda spongiicola]